MALQCVVPNCPKTSAISGISFHKFPDNRAMQKAWLAMIFNDSKRLYRDLGSMHVCSVHFTPDDYEQYTENVLKENAKPSLFLPENLDNFPRKKIKLRKVEDSSENLSAEEKTDEDSLEPSLYGHLPDLVLSHIFSYLSFEDRCNAAFVCSKWYDVSRSSPLWKKVDVKVKSPYHLLKFLIMLPSNVKYLNIFCKSFEVSQSLWLPDILCRLHDHCPEINTLIIENVFFAKRFCNASFTTNHVSCLSKPSYKQKKTGRKKVPRCLKECCSEKINQDKYIPENRPQKLCIFSLRYAHSFMSHLSSQISPFLPEVKVLDLTCSANIKPAALPFFLKLLYLEELYLVECPISNHAIKSLLQNLKGLKVLDLEGSYGVDDETFAILQQYGRCLEKLFLGNTHIESFAIDYVKSFINLQALCLRNTFIDDADISYFIVRLPKLKIIDASFCSFMILQIITLEAGSYEKDFRYTNEGEPTALCHHFKTKYMSNDVS